MLKDCEFYKNEGRLVCETNGNNFIRCHKKNKIKSIFSLLVNSPNYPRASLLDIKPSIIFLISDSSHSFKTELKSHIKIFKIPTFSNKISSSSEIVLFVKQKNSFHLLLKHLKDRIL